jgi:hypothetical protein
MGHPAFVADSGDGLWFNQRPIFTGWGARPGLPGKPHLFFKLQLLELAQRDAELVSLSTKTGPVGRGFLRRSLFGLFNFLILHPDYFTPQPPCPAMGPCCLPRPSVEAGPPSANRASRPQN